MGVRKMRLDVPCPACRAEGLHYTAADLDLPHFGDVTQLLFECAACGFRHSDFQIGAARDPVRYSYAVRAPDDVMVRVVRSTSGTIRIPELGILIEPGPASDAYVSNIEGVLVRVERVLGQLLRDAETDEQRALCQERLGDLQRAREGTFPFTFILEDPYGNSAVVHERAVREPLSPEAAADLKTGQITLDLQSGGEAPAGPGGDGHSNGAPGTPGRI